jgi:hypothetical protein
MSEDKPKTGPLPGRDSNRCFCAGWCREPLMAGTTASGAASQPGAALPVRKT